MTKQQIIHTFLDFGHFTKPVLVKHLTSDTTLNPKISLKDSRVLWGNSGNGKTTLACLMLRDWLCSEFPEGFELARYRELPVFLSMDSFERYVDDKNSFDEDRRYTSKLSLEEVKTAKFLILDDFWQVEGTARAIQAVKRELFEIFDYRYELGLQTVITTNLDLTELKNKDEDYKRIIDRILGLCISTEITGNSFRGQQKEIAHKGSDQI
jgi:DNA replication protein DnaC